MGGREESCLKMSTTQWLIVFNQAHFVDQGLPLSPISRQLLAKRLRMITSSHMLSFAGKKKLLGSNYFSYFVSPSFQSLPVFYQILLTIIFTLRK